MTRLERITMNGFKSFASRITVPFPAGFNCICGPNGSGKCVDYDTLVTLEDGHDVKIGDLVEEKIQNSESVKKLDDGFLVHSNDTKILTLDNDLKIVTRPIKTFIKRRAPDRMLFIKTRSGREIVSTSYHPFFGINENGIFSLKAEDIKKGEKIAVPRILRISKTSAQKKEFNRLFDSLYIPYSDKMKNVLASKIIESGLTQKEFSEGCNVPYTAVRTFLDGQSMRHDYLRGLSDKYDMGAAVTELKAKNQNKTFLVPSLSPETARFLGYMISEGRSTNSNQLWFVNNDTDLINDFVQICDKQFGLRANIFSYKGDTKDVIVFSKPLQVWLEGIFNLKIGSKSSEKCVPDIIFSSNGPIIKNFLSALFEGDGYFHLKGRCAYLEYATASKDLALGVQGLLLRMGILSNIKEKIKFAANTKNKTRKKYYSVYVYGEPLRKLVDELEPRGRKKTTVDEIKSINFVRNPNVDTISNINKIIKTLVKECKINIKRIRRESPKLAAYYENRCRCTRKGLKEIVSIVRKYGTITERAENIINQITLLAESDILWDEIIEVKEIASKNWVYDLTVDETHNYVANNLFVHNSNVIDGLLFVLGTTSARNIRAQKLQNLIFNGARNRKPADFCEVSLYLDNKEGKIPGDEEIKISRRVTRSGISIYKLNGKTVTRSKILDILSHVGLSPDGYNIIMQGDVTKVIEMSPKERRGVIDEISGIAEFDEKKEKADRELERVEVRVRENMIVVAEKQKLVSRLKEERENAMRYRKLDKKLRKTKASLINSRLTTAEEKMGKLDEEIIETEKRFSEQEQLFNQAESELENLEKNIQESGKAIIEKTRDIELMREIDRTNTEILRKKDRIDFNERAVARLRGTADLGNAVKAVLSLKKKGVFGVLKGLLRFEEKYSIAIDVALGRHATDIVVDTEETAADCIKYLREKKIGRARFLPINRIRGRKRENTSGNIIGYALDLVKFDDKYRNIMEYALENTLIAENIDTVKKIRGFRVATLDGDLVEKGGAMIGGFYKKKKSEVPQLLSENKKLEEEIAHLEQELEEKKTKQEEESKEVTALQTERTEREKQLEDERKKRKKLLEERLALQNIISRKKVEKAKIEASVDNLKIEMQDFADVEGFIKAPQEELQKIVQDTLVEINRIGPVNLKALEEFDVVNVEFEELKKKLDRLLEEKEAISRVVDEISKKRYEKFMETFNEISEHLARIYNDLSGGEARLRLEEDDNIESGLVIEANPSGKKILNLDSMSGGEKTLTSLAFLFAVMQHYSAPFYILDEVDAALDKANTKRILNLVKKYSKHIQFIVITHNDLTISEADKVFGVSMEEGVSKVFGIDMPRGG